MGEAYANIHHYDMTTLIHDEDGEPMFGYYFEIIGKDGNALAPLFGPYATKDEVEAACKREWDRHG